MSAGGEVEEETFVDRLRQENAALRREIRGWIERYNEVLARADARADYAVYIVPSGERIRDAMTAMHADRQVETGDHIRCSATGEEWVLSQAGIWERITGLQPGERP